MRDGNRVRRREYGSLPAGTGAVAQRRHNAAPLRRRDNISTAIAKREHFWGGINLQEFVGDHKPKQRGLRELLRLYAVDLYFHMRALRVSGGKQLLLLSLKGNKLK